jgi:hypothetical protein
VDINLTQPGRVRETAFFAGVYPQLYSTFAIWSDTQVLNLVRKFYVLGMRVSWLYSNSYGLEAIAIAIAIAIIPIAFSVWRFYIKFGVFILSLTFLY